MSNSRSRGLAGWARLTIALSATALMAAFLAVVPVAASTSSGIGVIVRTSDGAGNGAEDLVEALGGSIEQPLDLIGGFSATIPSDAVSTLEASPGVTSVTRDGTLQLMGVNWEDATTLSAVYKPRDYAGSMYWVAQEITGAAEYWSNGYTGAGVDIALIDSGVAPVNGLTYPGKVVNAADLSFESQADNLRYLDTFGHGTHLAGIMVGRDDGAATVFQNANDDDFLGMAPDARVINVKVADHEGAVDVSQVIAAIDWTVQHRNDDGMNIRVINLSFGTDSTQSAALDPLSFAVEQAWKQGIVVVVAAGNDGNLEPLRDPAFNPYVIAVGASEGNKTYSAADDVVAEFSNCGTDERHVDVVAPGKSIVSLRDPGSNADVNYPTAVVADRFFLGSGSSQSAAVVSGAVALIIDERPRITPDEVKALLMATAQPIPAASSNCQGAGLIDLSEAIRTATPKRKDAAQSYASASGTGTIEGARGSDHLTVDGVLLDGEQDIFGVAWNADAWAEASAAGSSWSGGEWNGSSWSGSSWSGSSWSGSSWSDYGMVECVLVGKLLVGIVMVWILLVRHLMVRKLVE